MQNSFIRKGLFLLFIFLTVTRAFGGQPALSTVYYQEGAALFKAGDIYSAEQKFLESLKESPSYSLAYYGLGRVYISTDGKADEAITCLRKSVELDPGLARGYFYLGLAELIDRRYVEALHSFKNAYDRDKRFVESLYNIAVIYDLLGNSYRAFVYYRQYVDETEK